MKITFDNRDNRAVFLREKIYKCLFKKPLTLKEISKILHFKNFEDFYDGSNYHNILNPEFWSNVEYIKNESNFEESVVKRICNDAIQIHMKSEKRNKIKFWIPAIISVISLVISIFELFQ